MNEPDNKAGSMIDISINKDIAPLARDKEVGRIERDVELDSVVRDSDPTEEDQTSFRERQSRLEGSHEQLDKRIDTSSDWVKYHSNSMEVWMQQHSRVLVALLLIIAAAVLGGLLKNLYSQPPPSPQSIAQKPPAPLLDLTQVPIIRAGELYQDFRLMVTEAGDTLIVLKPFKKEIREDGKGRGGGVE